MAMRYGTIIEKSSVLSTDYNFFFIKAVDADITLTLPPITSDGVFLKIHRVDSNPDRSVMIVSDNPKESIYELDSIKLDNKCGVELYSLDNVWYECR